MSPQRLVAALAALAIGFGVTLVGVSVAEDEPMLVGTEQSDGADVEDEVDGGGIADGEIEPATQEEEPADEPDAAEVQPADAPQGAPSTQRDGESQEGVPVESTSTTTTTTTSTPSDSTPADSDDRTEVPDSGTQCVGVLRLEYLDGAELVVLVANLGGGEVLVLDGAGEFFIDLDDEENLVAFATGSRLVEFEDGRPVAFGNFCTLEEQPGDQVEGGIDAEQGDN